MLFYRSRLANQRRRRADAMVEIGLAVWGGKDKNAASAYIKKLAEE